MSEKETRTGLQAIARWEMEALDAWFAGDTPAASETPRNFQAGFVGTWTSATGAVYRIIQSGLSAWSGCLREGARSYAKRFRWLRPGGARRGPEIRSGAARSSG